MNENIYSEYIEVLKKVALFDGIEQQELLRMLSCLGPNIKRFKKGEYVAIMGHDFEGIGIVLEGEVTIAKENQAGNRVLLSKLTPSKLFGEMIAFSDNTSWIVTIEAIKDCTIMYIKPEVILGHCRRLCLGHRLLATNMVRIVSNKALNLKRKIDYLTIKSMRGKICQFLLENYSKKKEMTFMVRMNRNELAEFLNVSRPSMSRELGKMKEEGIIDYYKNSFKIYDLEELRKGLEEN